MSIIAKFLTAVTEPQFKLARDLTAMAIADGEITSEEIEAIHTERLQDEEASRELLRRNLEPHKAFSALWGFIYLRRPGQSSGTWVLVS